MLVCPFFGPNLSDDALYKIWAICAKILLGFD